MKRFLAGLLSFTAAVQMGLAGTDVQYINNGTVTVPPMIDAKIFDNRGLFDLTGTNLDLVAPYSTQNTETFLNSGTIRATPGMRFGLFDAAGTSSRAKYFSNGPSASIVGIERPFSRLKTYEASVLNPYRDTQPTYIDISADTIISRGVIQGTIGGEISISGGSVDLARSAVDIESFSGGTTGASNGGGFFGRNPIPGMTDNYWQYEQIGMQFDQLLVVTTNVTSSAGVSTTNVVSVVQSPFFPASDRTTPPGTAVNLLPFRTQGFGGTNGIDLLPFVWITTNPPPPGLSTTNPATNQVITVVLVHRTDTNILVDASSRRGFDPNAPLPTVSLRFTKVATNLITGLVDATVLKLDNTYGSAPDTLYVSNSISGNTYWPSNLVFSRETIPDVPNPFSPVSLVNDQTFQTALSNLVVGLNNPQKAQFTRMQGAATNAALIPTILTKWSGGGLSNSLTYTNNGATNPFMAYYGSFASTATSVPKPANVPDASNTNLSGRISITANTLDLTKTRIRSQGPVLIKADNLVGNAGAVVDAPYVDAEFGADSGHLDLTGVFRSTVERFQGDIKVFATLWTNTVDYTYTVTNAPANPTDPPTTTDTTVTLTSIFQLMMVDANLIGTLQTPFVDLKLRSKDTILGDVFQVHRLTAFGGESLTVNGKLSIIGDDLGTPTWDATAFPNMVTLKNNGTIFVKNEFVAGSDRPFGYTLFENNGTIIAQTLSVTADTIRQGDFGGILATNGPILLTAKRAELASAMQTTNHGFVQIEANQLQLGGHDIVPFALGSDYVDITAHDTIERADGPVVFETKLGMRLASMPPVVDTTTWNVHVTAPNFQEAVITWPGADNGGSAIAAGTQWIIGLVLDGGAGSTIRFAPTDAKNALYVGVLNISSNIIGSVVSTNGAGVVVTNSVMLGDIQVPDNFTVYYSTANVPADQLSTLTGGRFRQLVNPIPVADVMEFVNGKISPVSRGIRYSMTLDSDGDGIVNALDSTPFSGVVVQNAKIIVDGQPGFRITWEAGPNQAYEVQYTEDSAFGVWKALQKVSNNSGDHQTLWIRDPIPDGESSRSYRVIYAQ